MEFNTGPMNFIRKNTEHDISKSPTKIFMINSFLSVLMLFVVALSLFFFHYPDTVPVKMVMRKYKLKDGNTIFIGEMTVPSSTDVPLKEGMTVKISFQKYPLNKYGFLEGRLATLNRNEDRLFTVLTSVPPSKKLKGLLDKTSFNEHLVAEGDVLIRDLRLYQKIFRSH